MKKLRNPYLCNSFGGCNPPQTYCIRCSHATFRGQATIKGKRYRWEYEPYCGPAFERRGEFNWHPNPHHPVWAAFEKWLGKLLDSGKDGGK
jgi:hypothetical protein